MSEELEDDITTDKSDQTWKKIICFFLGHNWYAPLSHIQFCQRCLLSQTSEYLNF